MFPELKSPGDPIRANDLWAIVVKDFGPQPLVKMALDRKNRVFVSWDLALLAHELTNGEWGQAGPPHAHRISHSPSSCSRSTASLER